METFILENQLFIGLIVTLVFAIGFAFFAMGGADLFEGFGDTRIGCDMDDWDDWD
ncbi:MAG: hypothetical protein KDB00_25170 [Planctomycetales bacterium]|nr:hypothetical protein [Planctomycetales bacterium]